MSAVRAWVENLVVVVLLASVSEMLLPEGATRKYVRLVLGLVVTLAILQPLAAWLHHDRWLGDLEQWEESETSLWPASPPGGADWQRQAQRVQKAGQAAAEHELADRLAEEVSAFLLLVPGVKNAQAQVQLAADGSLARLAVKVETDAEDPAATMDRVRAFLQHAYAIAPQRLSVEVTRPAKGA